eukprot:m.228919 g.228919  ORF g.228919 m.228919 type:complete len:550 (+) comp33548_c9_seq1:156-1805(+)
MPSSSKEKKSKKEKKEKKSSKEQVKVEEPKAPEVVESTVDEAEITKKCKKKLKKQLGRKPTEDEISTLVAKKLKKIRASSKQDGKAGKAAQATDTTKASIPTSSGAMMNSGEAAKYRDSVGLTVTGTAKNYIPCVKFEQSGIPKDLLGLCKGFDTPTPIQAQCWPIILTGADCIGIAKTGSGKTIAFGLPGIMHVRKSAPKAVPHKPVMLVIAPTRELAVQTFDVCVDAGKLCSPSIESICVYGGVPKGPQVSAMRRGVHVVIATPGRLFDLMNQGEIELPNVTYIVLDEADRMLDLGFEKEIKHFMASCAPVKQCLMFSATWPVEVQTIGGSYMKNPVRVTVGVEDRLVSNHSVSQTVEVMENYQKDERVLQLLKQYAKGGQERVLIFALYKKEAARLEVMLRQKGYDATAIHGDLNQDKRTQVLDNFKSGHCKIMIATDVAARGLDVPELNYVINYTFPLTVEDYVHRIGRTGRAGKLGTSYTFFTQLDKGLAGALGNILREAKAKVPEALLNFGQGTKRKKHSLYGDLSATQEALMGQKATKIRFD